MFFDLSDPPWPPLELPLPEEVPDADPLRVRLYPSVENLVGFPTPDVGEATTFRARIEPIDPTAATTRDPFEGLFACKECHKAVDMKKVGSARVGAHGRDFCSMVCSEAWEKNPENAAAVRKSHERAKALGYPYDKTLLGES